MTPGAPPEEPEGACIDPGLDIDLLRRRRERVLAVLAVSVVVAAALLGSLYLLRPQPAVPRDLITAAQQSVMDAVGPGLACSFSKPPETTVERVDDDRYVVRGQALAVDRIGRARGYRFECAVSRRGKGAWRPDRLSLTPVN